MLLTLIGIKILRECFPGSKNEWKLVAQKGTMFFRKQMGCTEKVVTSMIDRVKYKLIE